MCILCCLCFFLFVCFCDIECRGVSTVQNLSEAVPRYYNLSVFEFLFAFVFVFVFAFVFAFVVAFVFAFVFTFVFVTLSVHCGESVRGGGPSLL